MSTCPSSVLGPIRSLTVRHYQGWGDSCLQEPWEPCLEVNATHQGKGIPTYLHLPSFPQRYAECTLDVSKPGQVQVEVRLERDTNCSPAPCMWVGSKWPQVVFPVSAKYLLDAEACHAWQEAAGILRKKLQRVSPPPREPFNPSKVSQSIPSFLPFINVLFYVLLAIELPTKVMW